MWFSKYRPTEFDELSLNRKTKEYLNSIITKQDIPNLLLVGNPGSGKTTIAKILMSKIPCTILELNGSSKDRGIETMKTKVVDFACSHSKTLNVVFIDEADGLTPEAQDALKTTIEKYHDTTRFIFTGNSIYKITDAIKSRCIALSFEQFPKRSCISLCKSILDKEEIEYENETVKKVVELTYPDIRSCINLLEHSSFSGKLSLQEDVSDFEHNFSKLAKYIQKGDVESILRLSENIINFDLYYRMFINAFVASNQLEKCLTVSEWYARNDTVIDKVINFVGLCSELILMDGKNPKLRG
jgi:replication factor C small subunit